MNENARFLEVDFSRFSDKEKHEIHWRILYSEVVFIQTGKRPGAMVLTVAFNKAHQDCNDDAK